MKYLTNQLLIKMGRDVSILKLKKDLKSAGPPRLHALKRTAPRARARGIVYTTALQPGGR